MKTKHYGIAKPSVHWVDQNPGKNVAELVREALDNIDAALFAASTSTAKPASSQAEGTAAEAETSAAENPSLGRRRSR